MMHIHDNLEPDFENEYNIRFTHEQEANASKLLLLVSIFGSICFVTGIVFWAVFGSHIIQLLTS